MNTGIAIDFGMCEVCGKKDGRPGHDCDGGEALRKAARELFGPAMDLVERVIAKAGTGVLRGVFEVVAERDAARAALAMLYDKWENGDPCWQDADEANDSLGNAFKLTDEEEKSVLAAIGPAQMCSDCPPAGYPTDKTRCVTCPRTAK